MPILFLFNAHPLVLSPGHLMSPADTHLRTGECPVQSQTQIHPVHVACESLTVCWSERRKVDEEESFLILCVPLSVPSHLFSLPCHVTQMNYYYYSPTHTLNSHSLDLSPQFTWWMASSVLSLVKVWSQFVADIVDKDEDEDEE